MSSGIKVTQQGVSVRKAADYQEVLDSRWPFLEFEFMDEIELITSITNQNAFVSFYTHKLGFLPAFFIIVKSSTPAVDYAEIVAVDDKIGFNVFSLGTTTNITFRAWLAVINRDISREYRSQSKQITPGPSVGPQKHGIKVVGRGADIKDSSKANFALHTNAKSLAIHMHGIATATAATSNELRLDHDVGYPPTYFVAKRAVQIGSANPIKDKVAMESLNAGSGISDSTAIRLTIRGAQSALLGDYVYLILKDPVDVAR